MKLLHLSDIHFGTKFLNKDPKIRQLLIDESYKTFDRVIDYVLKNDVKALLIPGDLFDGEYRSLRAEKYLIDTFEGLNSYGIKVFYALGNHDSNITFKNGFLRELPSNVIIFNEEKPIAYLLEDEVYIHSCGHQSNIENRNLVKKFPHAKAGFYNIGLLHCSIVSNVKVSDLYLPTKVEDLESKNYDYWALGHIHKRTEVGKNIYYSGSLYGLSSKETGNKGGLLINLEDQECTVKFIDFSTINYETIAIDLQREAIGNEYELLSILDQKLEGYNKKMILKLIFTGETPLYSFLKEAVHREELIDEIARKDKILDVSFDVSAIERTVHYEDYIREDNILGYIEKNLENEDFREKILEHYAVDLRDKSFVKELMNMMVGASNED
jgi:DNA repair exonuclease SbcCD nuclease subunit